MGWPVQAYILRRRVVRPPRCPLSWCSAPVPLPLLLPCCSPTPRSPCARAPAASSARHPRASGNGARERCIALRRSLRCLNRVLTPLVLVRPVLMLLMWRRRSRAPAARCWRAQARPALSRFATATILVGWSPNACRSRSTQAPRCSSLAWHRRRWRQLLLRRRSARLPCPQSLRRRPRLHRHAPGRR